MYHNLEKSAFRRGDYVGYAHGIWHIAKAANSDGNWHARKVIQGTRDIDQRVASVSAFTLRALSEKLAVIAASPAG